MTVSPKTLTFPTNPEQGPLLGASARSPTGTAGHGSLCRGRALKARLRSPRAFRRAACGRRRGLQAWVPNAQEWLITLCAALPRTSLSALPRITPR